MSVKLHCPSVLLADGWHDDVTLVLTESGLIEAIWPRRAKDAKPLPGPVLPGMVNVHSHIHQRLIAGLTGRRGDGDDSFWSWREHMYRAVEMLTGPDFEILAAHAFMELLEGGYTTIGEFHYPHRLGEQPPEQTARQVLAAAERAGCGLTLLPVWYRYGGFGRQALAPRQKSFALSLEELTGLVETMRAEARPDLQRVGVAPHSLRAVDAGDLAGLIEHVPDGPIHLHVSEQPAEVSGCLEHYGCRPIELLLEHVEIDRRWCLIHATHADESEWRALAKSSAVIGICPTTEADLGDGLFPVDEYLQAGGRVAVGSDSNLVTSAAEELRLLEWGQRLRRQGRNVLCGAGESIGTALWRAAASAGADALDQPVGRLEVGRRADLVVLSDNHPLLAGLPPAERLDSLLLSPSPGMIDQVWVGGRRVVSAGQHPARAELGVRVTELRRNLVGAMRP